MKFKQLTEKEISDFIYNDPKLVYLGFSDQEMAYMYEHKEYKCNSASSYIGIEKDNALVCVLRWELFNFQVVSVHPYIASRLHGTGIATEVFNFMYNHFKNDTDIRKVITFVSEPCIHVVKAAIKHGFIQEGFMTNACTWRQELCGIYIFGLDIIREVE